MIYDYQYTLEVSPEIKPRIYRAADGSWAGRWGPRSFKGTEEEVQQWAYDLEEIL